MWRRIDHVMRFAYVLLCPVMIAALTALLPVTGIMINALLATVIALAGSERWVARTQNIKLVGRPLAKFGRLGEYYRANPPKPLLYYVLYPLFAPYWLLKKSARTELLVYKRLGVFALVITVVTSTIEYLRVWRPLPFGYFANAMFATTVLQLFFTFMFVMPIVTTVITFHSAGHRKSLVALGVIGLGFGVLVAVGMRKTELIPLATQQRVHSRMKWKPDEARRVMSNGLDAAVAVLMKNRDDVTGAIAAARHELAPLFRADEQRAFHVVKARGVLVLYAKARNKKYAWIGRTETGPITSGDVLPAEVRDLLKLQAGATPWP